MPRSIRVLIVEDHIPDAELMVHELHRAGFEPKWQRVETEPDYPKQLSSCLDIILADHNLPQFSVPRALELVRENGVDIPLIVVTGSMKARPSP